MKVTFRCKQSGNTVSFSDPTDIKSMREETHYEEIKDEVQETNANENANENARQEAEQEVLKKRGRPAKAGVSTAIGEL
jgi:hypothetical protein